MANEKKIRIGITQGDTNGIGCEVILKTFANPAMQELCTPVIYGSSKILTYHRKAIDMQAYQINITKSATQLKDHLPNLVEVIEEDIKVEMGKADKQAGRAAFLALEAAVADLKNGNIDAIVTAPISKENIQSSEFSFPGHTEYLEASVGDGEKARNLWLLAASYVFYMGWNAKYVLLLFTSTLITYLSGLALEAIKGSSREEAQKTKGKKWVVAASFLLNLGILFYFKYMNFFLDTLTSAASLLGVTLNVPRFDILLPVGISFFTFQAAGYLVDVYQGKYKAETNFVNFALFVSFFPQLLSGPIGRGGELLPQYRQPKKPGFQDLRNGLCTMTWGYFLKLVIADRAAMLVDSVYGAYASLPGICLVFATVVYALQIYCDFAGYSAMAIGAGQMLGIRLPVNFRTPYFAQSVQEFWRRWHISLSTWFRDYVYFPLGGSRCPRWKNYRNILIVFLLSGLWHGASWSFALWGLLHGAYQILGKQTKGLREAAVRGLGIRTEAGSWKVLRMAVTFLLVDFAWLFFRAEGLGTALDMLRHIGTDLRPLELLDALRQGTMGLDLPDLWVLLLSTALLTGADIARYRGADLRGWFAEQNFLLRELLLSGFMLLIIILGIWGNGFHASSFIYFQF